MLDYLKLMFKKQHKDGLKNQAEFTKVFSDIMLPRPKTFAFKKLFNIKPCNELPLSFAFIAAFPCLINTFASKEFITSPIGLIHLSAEFTRHQQINYREKITVKIKVEHAGTHPKGVLLKITSELIQNDLLCIKNTNVMLQVKSGGKNAKNAIVKQFKASDSSTINQQTLWRYARASGDYNPIHLSSLLAKIFGMRTAIVHGMYLVHYSLLSQHINSGYIKATFKKPCPVGTTVGIDDSTEQLQVFSNTTDLHLTIDHGHEPQL
ncbi:MaoC/PaaZ C-terminal domain-containing protein [Colwelliaceae bacterium BS250]